MAEVVWSRCFVMENSSWPLLIAANSRCCTTGKKWAAHGYQQCYILTKMLACFSDRYIIVGGHHSSVPGSSSQQWAHGSAVMTALIRALMLKVKEGWRPERTIIFCSWGETVFGKIGSYEWAEVRRYCLLQIPENAKACGIVIILITKAKTEMMWMLRRRPGLCWSGTPRFDSPQMPVD